MQDQSGFWCGELEGDSILQSEYILLKFIVEQENDPRLPKIANFLADAAEVVRRRLDSVSRRQARPERNSQRLISP